MVNGKIVKFNSFQFNINPEEEKALSIMDKKVNIAIDPILVNVLVLTIKE